MKKIILCLLILNCQFSIFHSYSQTPMLYSMTNQGGTHDSGTIFSFNVNTNTETVLWDFGGGKDGAFPTDKFVYDKTNGLFYAMTFNGGKYDSGTIVSFNPKNNSEQVVWNFKGMDDGRDPSGDLVYYDSTGLLYGMTFLGGAYDSGTIFSFNPATNTETILWSFGNGLDGNHPEADLAYDSYSGIYYGTTYFGGTYNKGTIISFNPKNNKEDVVWSFGNGSDGYWPYGNLTYDTGTAHFYGMTGWGGAYQSGTIFNFNPIGNTEVVAWSFGSGVDGSSPNRTLIYDSYNGIYYATTQEGGSNFECGKYGCGAIIAFKPSNGSESVVWSFGYNGDGRYPAGDLLYDPVNDLFYGTTSNDWVNYSGTIYSFNPRNNTDSVLYYFKGGQNDGADPIGNFIFYPSINGINSIAYRGSILTIYPNPCNGVFTIQMNNKQLRMVNGKIQIYNELGEQVFDEILQQVQGNYQVNISSQPNGIYFYRVITDNGEFSENGKIIIAK